MNVIRTMVAVIILAPTLMEALNVLVEMATDYVMMERVA